MFKLLAGYLYDSSDSADRYDYIVTKKILMIYGIILEIHSAVKFSG